MGNKITLGLLKQLIREELNVLKKGKIRLNEQDGGYTFYIIEGSSVPVIKIAVKGNAIYSVIADPATGEFKVGSQIGGGSLADFKTSPGQGIYLEGQKHILQKTQYPSEYFTEKLNFSNYGFVFDDKGRPSIVGINKNGDHAFTIAKPTGGGSSTIPSIQKDKDKLIPPPETPKEIPEIASFNANFNFNSAALANNEEFDKQLTKYLEGFIYLKKHEPLKLIVATSASIDTPNVSRDYELTQERAKAVAVKIGEITRNNPRIPKFTVMQMPLGQTDRFAKGVKAPKYNRDQTAVNRKVLVGTVDKITTFLNNYPGEISTGKPK